MHHLPPLLHSVAKALDITSLSFTIADVEAPGMPLVFVNQGFEQLTGYSRHEVLGRSCRFLQSQRTESDVVERLREALARQEPTTETLENQRKDGSSFWNRLMLSPYTAPDGHRYMLGFQHDVTDYRRLKLAKAVFDSTHDGILVTDANKNIIDTNPAFTSLTGYEREEAIGHKPHLLSSGKHDAVFYQTLFAAVARDGFWTGDIWNTRKDGSQLIEHTTISAIHDETGQVINYVGVFRDITQLRLNQARLERLAIYDPLTGLYNREHFNTLLESQLAGLQFNESGLAVLFIDLDDFKPVNDRFGHAAGDKLLIEMSRRLKRLIRSTDLVSRFGGDEFVIALTGVGNGECAVETARKLIDDLIQPFLLDSGEQVRISVSIGVAFTSDYRLGSNALIDSADHAMYEAKLSGKNRIARARHFVESGRHDAYQRIRETFEEGELELYYQPIVDLTTQETLSFEALARWQHPQKGLLGPQHFIDILMNSSLSLPFCHWLIREAGRMAKLLANQGYATPISINLAQDQIETGSFLRAITETRDALQLSQPFLTIEVLESTHFHDLDLACSQLLEAKQLGTTIALDDFGSGISSITYASHLPIDTIKIDRSAIINIDTREDQRQFVGGIIGMGHAMQRRVLAEGVERESQLVELRKLGCDLAQGFLFGKPMPSASVLERYIGPTASGDYPMRRLTG
ncbi:PAS domain S-box-containing protein/diguanylate cyclase (GGDEF)-like protein [Modicisalibacter xianhensis]|uniref:PAS domain S-box-containing protein/diguanylate cyclase (GGDEF)-like protein n=1 Tax=Modicisalibacter xianhensis TaxID=442341 RepID=A0A4R8G7Z1_9GAMM|nr:EAL domain-containing protein [Halomonas xianhensis]TDX33011.1 PAS domain S-box-containing protein/diguanylate cyclase (GGDEF)-like protein [Halomonas xianhensis]